MTRPGSLRLLEPFDLGGVRLRNRIVRAGTSESMAGERGEVTEPLIDLYARLAAGHAGLIVTGHLFCHPRGRYARGQTGIDSDALVPGLSRLAAAVHREGGAVLAQLAHAGSQSRVPGNRPLAPSAVPNFLTGRDVGQASDEEIRETIASFAAAARRAVAAGFDGVHVHGANGYLLSEFGSPLANRRQDRWGGDEERRDAFAVEVVHAVRAAVPAPAPVTMKIGFFDAEPGGLGLEESVRRAARLAGLGLDAIEVSCNLMSRPSDSAHTYVAVGGMRAAADLLPHRVLRQPEAEAYFRQAARRLRAAVGTPLILTGGMRRTETMEEVLASGDADLIGMARPLIREPDLALQVENGRRGQVACTSCNLCLMHESHHSLRCWRTPRRRLLEHALYRLRGGFSAPLEPLSH